MKILKCSDPTCNTHKGFEAQAVNFTKDKVHPVPDSWTCDWHIDPGTGAGDHVRAVRDTRAAAERAELRAR